MANEGPGMPEVLDLGSLPDIIRVLVDELREHAQQGATDKEWLDQQAMCVVEEAGEFIKNYRKWRGFARTAATPGQVEDELADVIVSTMCMIRLWLCQFGRGDQMTELVAKKLGVIFSRGWVNKDTPLFEQGSRIPADWARVDPFADRESDGSFRRQYLNQVADDYERGYCGTERPHPPHQWRVSGAQEFGLEPTVHTCPGRRPHPAPNRVPEDVDPESNPLCVFKQEENGEWTYLGHSLEVDLPSLQAADRNGKYALGRQIREWRDG